jgi:hypothetical protein
MTPSTPLCWGRSPAHCAVMPALPSPPPPGTTASWTAWTRRASSPMPPCTTSCTPRSAAAAAAAVAGWSVPLAAAAPATRPAHTAPSCAPRVDPLHPSTHRMLRLHDPHARRTHAAPRLGQASTHSTHSTPPPRAHPPPAAAPATAALQWFEDLGGFEREENIAVFVDWALKAVDLFGDRIKLWATFNEPTVGATPAAWPRPAQCSPALGRPCTPPPPPGRSCRHHLPAQEGRGQRCAHSICHAAHRRPPFCPLWCSAPCAWAGLRACTRPARSWQWSPQARCCSTSSWRTCRRTRRSR